MAESVELSSDTRAAVVRLADISRAGVTVLCGLPAAGKSTLTRMLAEMVPSSIVLEKDSFAPQLENAVMLELTGLEHDRDSELYRRVVAPGLYAAMVSQALAVARSCPVIVDAPCLGYAQTAAEQGISLSEHIRSIAHDPDADIRAVWVDTDPAVIRDRMARRGAARDLPKLASWDAYRKTVLESGIAVAGRQAADRVIMN